MQKRTSPLKFGDLAEKSELNSVSNLSTKVLARSHGALEASTRYALVLAEGAVLALRGGTLARNVTSALGLLDYEKPAP